MQYIYKLNGCTNYSVVRHRGSYGSEEGLYEVAHDLKLEKELGMQMSIFDIKE